MLHDGDSCFSAACKFNQVAYSLTQLIYSQVLVQNEIVEINDQFLFMRELSFLVLSNNRIRKMENLRHLDCLEFLDLSNNAIHLFAADELPTNLRVLNIAGNPCVESDESYQNVRRLCIQMLPRLEMMDDIRIKKSEKEKNTSVRLRVVDSDSDSDRDNVEDSNSDGEDNVDKNDVHASQLDIDLGNDLKKKEQLSQFDERYQQMRHSLESARSMRSSQGSSNEDIDIYQSHEKVFDELLAMNKEIQLAREKRMLSSLEQMKKDFSIASERMIEASAKRRTQFKMELEKKKRDLRAELSMVLNRDPDDRHEAVQEE